jgi:hypothetical protein
VCVLRKILIVFSLLSLAACASSGNVSLKDESAASVDQKIQDGVTTKADLRKAFGDASETSFTEGGAEIWRYVYVTSKVKAVSFVPYVNLLESGANVDKRELVILFGADGVVRKHTMNVSKQETKTGLIQ